MNQVLLPLKEKFPITWDRFVKHSNHICAFGWIERTDGQRDFAIVWFDEGSELKDISFATSSAKYSKQLAELLGSEHVDCEKVPEGLR